MAARAPAISSGPRGAPWLPAVPAFLGAAKPMMVRQAISVGLRLRSAKPMAPSSAEGLWPFTRFTAQP